MVRSGEAEIVDRRRDGVNDQRALPAARRTRRLPGRRPHRRGLDDARRADVRLRALRHGPGHRATQRGTHLAGAPGRVRGTIALPGRGGDRRRGTSSTRSPPCPSPNARARTVASTSTRASAARRPPTPSRALRGAFEADGTITAGNASQISDGAAAVLVMSADARGGARARTTGRSRRLRSGRRTRHVAAAAALQRHLPGARPRADVRVSRPRHRRDQRGVRGGGPGVDGRAGYRRGPPQRQRRRDRARVTPSACRAPALALTALMELRRRGGGTAAVALCGGGGQGDGAILRSL